MTADVIQLKSTLGSKLEIKSNVHRIHRNRVIYRKKTITHSLSMWVLRNIFNQA